jgi:hypothetical protein
MEEIASVCVERQVYIGEPPRTVVLGRVVRPLKAAVSDVTVPRYQRSALHARAGGAPAGTDAPSFAEPRGRTRDTGSPANFWQRLRKPDHR